MSVANLWPAILMTCATAALAGVGASYNSRNPVPCPPVAGAAPTVAEATELFRCTNEVEASHLYLIEEVRLEIGRERPFGYGDGYADIDQTLPVHPIRGDWVEYQCSNIVTYPAAAPNNCQVFDKKGGTGICYRTSFGDWRCQMQGAAANLRSGWVPPPR